MNLETEEECELSSTFVVSNINFQNSVYIRITVGVRGGEGTQQGQVPGPLSPRF